MSEYQKDEKEYVYEYNEDKKDISKLSIEKMITKKFEKNNEIEYIETNANEIIFNEKKNKEKDNDKNIENNKEEKDKLKEFNIDNVSQEEDNIITNTNKGYEIKDNCLIISMAEMTLETLEELKKLFLKDDKKKSRMNLKLETDQNKEDINDYNDYIQIFKKNTLPYEKRHSFDKINKIIFKNCSFNNDSIYNLKDFFTMLIYYPNLTKIAIYQNNMSKDFSGWKYFKQLLRVNFNIRWVSFKGANLNDKLFEGIILGMTLKRIRYLNLSKNRITNKGLYFLNKFLMKNQTLLILDLSYNQYVTNEGIKLITNALKMHPNINKVDLSHMKIKGSGHYIANFIRDNKCLETLYLKNCQFEKQDVEHFPTVFAQKDCQMLHLDLSLNPNIGEEGLKEIGKLITNNKSLISIGLDGINLSMNNYMPVFQGILKNKTIKSYSLNINPGLPLKGILNFLSIYKRN